MRRRFAWLALIALGIGAATLLYRGPGRALIRGHLGDVAATMLVYAMLGLLLVRVRPAIRAAVTLAIATAIELGQMLWQPTSLAGELTVGATFDALDFVAYVAGVALAVAWELARGRAVRSSTTDHGSRASTTTPAAWIEQSPTLAAIGAGHGDGAGSKPHER